MVGKKSFKCETSRAGRDSNNTHFLQPNPGACRTARCLNGGNHGEESEIRASRGTARRDNEHISRDTERRDWARNHLTSSASGMKNIYDSIVRTIK